MSKSIPHDIIVDIFSRLPVKSLLRFKSLGKACDSLISDPKFAETHLNRSTTDINISINRRRVLLASSRLLQSVDFEAANDSGGGSEAAAGAAAAVTLDFPSGMNGQDFEIVGSCNGLICLVFGFDNILLWNPSTRDAKKLPASITRGWVKYGFCYDSCIDDYKVVRVNISGDSDKSPAEVFTLKTNSWRRIEGMPLCIPHWHGHGKFTDGFLHWEVSREGIGEDARATSKFIISFDLVAEIFQELLPLPPYHDDETGNKKFASFRTFTILGGFPSIVWHDSLKYVVEVWVMKEFGVKDSWIKLLTSECQRPHPASMYQLLPLCFLKNNEILMGWSGIKLVIYNMIEETFRTLKVPYFGFPYRMVLYGESLVSPNCNGKQKKMKNREER